VSRAQHRPAGTPVPSAATDGTPLTDVWVSRSVSSFVPTAGAAWVGTVHLMSRANDLTDMQWALLEPVFNAPGKRGTPARAGPAVRGRAHE
jgi:hypothetical protein